MTSCVCWNGRKDISGYGVVYMGGRDRKTHRVAWEAKYGEIPKGLQVLHKCDNPSCVNPEHLFLGTQDDNMKDKVAKGRQAKGEDHGCSKLTEDDVKKIRLDTRTQREIAKDFNVSHTQIGYIKRRKKWRHI